MDFLAKPVDPDHLLLLVERALAQRRMATENHAAARGAGRAARRAANHRRRPGAAQRDAQPAPRGRAPTRPCCSRRERHRQGAVRARAARARARAGRPVRRHQLRRDSGDAARDRAVRPREGRVHRARSRASRAASSWRIAARCSSTRSASCRSALQAKILRALEEKRFERVGGTQSLQVDVRVVAATNRNLKARVADAAVSRGPLFPAVGVPDRRFRRCANAPGDIDDAGAAFRRTSSAAT